MKKAIIYIVLAIAMTGSAFADVKIKTKQTSSGQTSENTTYIKGKRQRSEMGNGMLVSITQCDLGRDLQLAPQTKSYTVSYYTDANGNPTGPVTQGASAPVTKGGIVTVTTTIKDTGERKQMFGYTARHIIQTMEMESSADACFPQKNKMEMDMWVIDAEFGLACTQNNTYRSYGGGKNGGCQDKYVSKTIGTGKSGYPLYQKMTSFDQSGKEQFSMVQEVVELSKTTLDAGLFEVPADYREVKDASLLYAAAPISSSPSSNARSDSSSMIPDVSSSNSSSSLNSSIKTAAQQPTTNTVGPKKAGTVRVGVITKTGAVGEGIAPADLAKAVENTFGQSVKGTKVEIVPIEAKLPAAQAQEATQKECDYLMLATASHKKGGGGFGFGKILGTVVGQTGIGHTGSTIGNIAGQMATTAIVAATLSNNVKAKDEVTLDIALSNGTTSAPALAKQFKAKAKGDGDDIITAVIEQAAQAIVDTIGK
jgi:hypothetical protein